MSATQNMIPIHRGFREHLIPEKMKSWISVDFDRIVAKTRLMTSLAHFNQAIMEFWIGAEYNTFQLSHYGVRGAGPIPKLRRTRNSGSQMVRKPQSRRHKIATLSAHSDVPPEIRLHIRSLYEKQKSVMLDRNQTPEGLLQTTAALFAEIWKSGAGTQPRRHTWRKEGSSMAPWSAVRLKVLSLGSNRTRGFGIVASVPLLAGEYIYELHSPNAETSFENFINKEDPSPECYPSKVAASPLENTENEMAQATGPDDDCENGSGDEDESDPVFLNDLLDGQDTEETADMGDADEEIPVSFGGSGKLVPMGNQLADSQKRDNELNHSQQVV
ncbi:hypothetical protein B0H14DRAFT_2572406 [Mycena olivaceomarginata]|nr:hypothetical protein B0H14DRAFT_2572406 [Mycena olivaceomarginata]